jgi:hypothetical protein
VIGADLFALDVPMNERWIIILVGALLWEVIETGLEKFTDIVNEPESFLNRWISDPLMAIIGGYVGMLWVGS